jgi:hypothetical protein
MVTVGQADSLRPVPTLTPQATSLRHLVQLNISTSSLKQNRVISFYNDLWKSSRRGRGGSIRQCFARPTLKCSDALFFQQGKANKTRLKKILKNRLRRNVT